MLLNKIEKLLMNNPVREAAQRYYEATRRGWRRSPVQSRRIGTDSQQQGRRWVDSEYWATSVGSFLF